MSIPDLKRDTELLHDIIRLITHHLLTNPDFCGSTEGRSLQDLTYQLTGYSGNRRTVTRVESRPLVNRTITLPIDIDNALTVAAEKAGISRNDLIEAMIRRAVT